MACNTYTCGLELCCEPGSSYENIDLNFSCEIDPRNPIYNGIVILWTGNTSVPSNYRGILQCYNVKSVTPGNYNPNAWEVDSQYIFSGNVRCNKCTQFFPCAVDKSCYPCNSITGDGLEATMTDRCQPTTCLNWDNPIIFHENPILNIQRIKVFIGSKIGDIDFTFSAFWRPNRFQIWWDYDGTSGGQAGMTKVCDSLFVGDGLRYFREDVKDFWRNRIEPVWFNCSNGCGDRQVWRSPLKPNSPNFNPSNYCITSGFTTTEIDNGPFLALRLVDRDNNWGQQYNPGNFPWGTQVPAFGSPGQIGVVTNYPRSSGNSRSSDGEIKLRFYKPQADPQYVYIYSYQGFWPTSGLSTILNLENQAYLRQIDGCY